MTVRDRYELREREGGVATEVAGVRPQEAGLLDR